MNNFLKTSILALLVAACNPVKDKKSEEGLNFSDDKVVLAEVNRISGYQMSPDDICIDRPPKFKDLVLVGYFAHDRGCDGGMIFYKGKKVDENKDIPAILQDYGWNDRSKREVLALEWVKNVALAWVYPLQEIDEDFKRQDTHTFMPPTVKSGDGEVTVAVWVKEPSGMTPEAGFYLYTAVFSAKEGEIIRTQITDRFSVDFLNENE